MSENENMENVNVELEEEPVETPELPLKAQKTDKTKKVKSDSKKSKPNAIARISRWWREMKSELKKVQWPSKKQTLNNTVVVLICVALVGVFIWVFDWLANGIIDALLSIFKG